MCRITVERDEPNAPTIILKIIGGNDHDLRLIRDEFYLNYIFFFLRLICRGLGCCCTPGFCCCCEANKRISWLWKSWKNRNEKKVKKTKWRGDEKRSETKWKRSENEVKTKWNEVEKTRLRFLVVKSTVFWKTCSFSLRFHFVFTLFSLCFCHFVFIS